MREILPRRAIVRPRAQSELSGERLLLEDVVEPHVRRGRPGAICVFGPSGSGKSTAMAHLAEVLARGSIVTVLDDPEVSHVTELSDRMPVLYSAAVPFPIPHLATCRLAGWGEDECLEYLMAAHKDACASVMRRLRAASSSGAPPGSPELSKICLDQMAEKELIADFDQALERHLDRQIGGRLRRRVGAFCMEKILGGPRTQIDELALWGHPGCLGLFLGRGLRPEELRLLRHGRVQLLLAADALSNDIRSDDSVPCMEWRLPFELVKKTAAIAKDDPAVLERLRSRFVRHRASQPMAASILHAAGVGWRPDAPLDAQGAYLSGVSWPALALADANFEKADLSGAFLSEVTLVRAWLRETRLRGAYLRGSALEKFAAPKADFSGADLSDVFADEANFIGANFTDARLESASLRKAWFNGATLQGARLSRADLRGATFRALPDHEENPDDEQLKKHMLDSFLSSRLLRGLPPPELLHCAMLTDRIIGRSTLEDADLSGADLGQAHLSGLDLRKTILAGARFHESDLSDCNLEGAHCAGITFEGANLRDALLTGSSMPEADFKGALLRRARLAEVRWERADLREADMREVTFHMGSSRSGLVFGDPSEGTRNGFYTDDYYDQSYRRPEEIRVANLTGADLRGALLDGTDFYLVDLRGARYTAEQEILFRKCGAILETRV